MTAMFEDVKEGIKCNLAKYRIPGADFDEVMYADDTICISEDTKTMNQFIQRIETVGAEYGLKLNKNKCELLTTELNPNIHFADNTKVKRSDEVKYLGCQLNQKGDTSKEIGKRIANAYNTLQKLQTLWKRSNCPITYKIIALDAIVRSKLIYGTDSMQLNEPDLKKMEKFHLQAMRKLLNWDTTFINRENKNEKIYQEINKRVADTTKENNKTRKDQNKKPKKLKKIVTFTEFYKTMKLKRIEKTINSKDEIHKITFDEQLRPRIAPARRQGRPKFKWAEKGIEEYWNSIRKNWGNADENYRNNWKEHDPQNKEQQEFIRQYASAAIPVPEEVWKNIQNTEPIWKEWKEGEAWVEKWIASGQEWNVYIREEDPPKETRPRPKPKPRPTFIRQKDEIHIPKPSYGYGSTFRSRFAFGKVTNKQARIHTAKNITRHTEHENPTDVEEIPTENPDEQPEEEDPFQDDRIPNQDECA